MTDAFDPSWGLEAHGVDGPSNPAHDAWFALAGGGVGTRGGPLATGSTSEPWTVVSGVYAGDGPDTHLLVGPSLRRPPVGSDDERRRRRLDFRTGTLWERVGEGPMAVEAIRFVSLGRPGIVATRTSVPEGVDLERAALTAPQPLDEGLVGGVAWCRVDGEPGGVVAAAAEHRGGGVVDDLVAVVGDPDELPEPDDAHRRLKEALDLGFDELLDEHRRAWQERWVDADVEVDGDDHLRRATRFSLFHLIGSVPDVGDAAVGARGLSGPAYRGHVFWDADTFVLPFLAATHPAAARAMLEYRIRRLPSARRNARSMGFAGARFPWESAHSGFDVTPRSARDRAGRVVPILTGEMEEHIVAQVAWATSHYLEWTGDAAFARGGGLVLLTETARYWASRIEVHDDGTGHISGVIGPDEYHEGVDDNAFTNVIARWNLRRAATAAAEGGLDGRGADADFDEAGPGEIATWRRLADALVDGYDAESGRYEQFRGFYELEPVIIAELAPRRPIAGDLLLGADRVKAAQVVKQADVLMLHHLVPDEVADGSLDANLRYYEPRTSHGSSLSPAIHASLFARAGDLTRALGALDLASRIDLDDLTESTAGGVHLATMGGLWQALVFGFAGVRPRGDRLVVDPRIPDAWDGLSVRVRFRGRRVLLRLEPDRLTVTAEGDIETEVGGVPVVIGTDPAVFRSVGSGWERA